MKLLNPIVCVCLILSLVGCAAQRPYTVLKPADAPAGGDPAPEPAATAKTGDEHPVWDKCKKTALTTVRVVTAPVWVPVGALFMAVILSQYHPGK